MDVPTPKKSTYLKSNRLNNFHLDGCTLAFHLDLSCSFLRSCALFETRVFFFLENHVIVQLNKQQFGKASIWMPGHT